MKTSILGLVMLLFSLPLAAQEADPDQDHCRHTKKKHVVSIIVDPNKPTQYIVKNKERFRYCLIDNNGGNGKIVWKFHPDIKVCRTAPGKCAVTLNAGNQTEQKKIDCPPVTGNAPFKCHLNLNQLQKHCDKVDADGIGSPMCLLDYTIWVDGKAIDPTILITPRPFEN